MANLGDVGASVPAAIIHHSGGIPGFTFDGFNATAVPVNSSVASGSSAQWTKMLAGGHVTAVLPDAPDGEWMALSQDGSFLDAAKVEGGVAVFHDLNDGRFLAHSSFSGAAYRIEVLGNVATVTVLSLGSGGPGGTTVGPYAYGFLAG